MKIRYHNYGFFSCCSIRLHDIIQYFNLHKTLPDSVDSSTLYDMYKPKGKTDITFDLFEHYNTQDMDIKYTDYVYINVDNFQYANYRHAPYPIISPFVKKYFTPSAHILQKSHSFISEYNIDVDNCVAVYYRGTDKSSETKLGCYEMYFEKLLELCDKYPDSQILLQTDTSQFIDYMKSKLGSNIPIIINHTKNTYNSVGVHYSQTQDENYTEIQNLLAICLLISKCRSIIMSSGNVSTWIMHYREHQDNIHQCLNGNWIND